MIIGLFPFLGMTAEVPVGATIEQIDPGRLPQREAAPPQPLSQQEAVYLPKKEDLPPIPQAEKVKFVLHRLIIEGNTVFTESELRVLYQDKLGKEISLADLLKIPTLITKKYRDAGFVLTHAIIPPQTIDRSGTVRIQMIEGYIHAVHVKGKLTSGNQHLLEQYGERIARVRPTTMATLERYALLANDLPGLKVRFVLVPSVSEPGAADLTVLAREHHFGMEASTDNLATKIYGSEEYTLMGSVHGVTPGGSLSARTVQSYEASRLQFYELAYQQQLNSDGLTWITRGNTAKTDPDLAVVGLEGLDSPGKSTDLSTMLRYPILRSRRQNLFWDLEFEGLNSNTDFISDTLFEDRIRSVRTGVTYDFLDPLQGMNVWYGQFSQGFDALGAEASPPSRPGGELAYSKVKGYLSRSQPLPQHFSWYIATEGQYGFDELLSAEEFGYGGSVFGYAYDPSEITGDRGISGKTELRYTLFPTHIPVQYSQLFIYYDVGEVWNINSGTQPSVESAASAGGGIRAELKKHITLSFLIGKPLTHTVEQEDNKDPRAFFTVSFRDD